MNRGTKPSAVGGDLLAEELIAEARHRGSEPLGKLLELYQNYLTILATSQINPRLRRRLAPSDLVQEAMLAVHRDFGKFRGV